MQKSLKWLTLVLLCYFAYAIAETPAPQRFTLRTLDNVEISKQGYACKLLKMALEESTPEYGTYEIDYSTTMNDKRSFSIASDNTLPNFFFTSAYTEDSQFKQLTHTDMPLLQGVLGYRVCFYNNQNARSQQKIETLSQLKQLSIGQAWDWPDVTILRDNGFNVVESTELKHLYPMLKKNRFDLFCRGINEIAKDQKQFKNSPNIKVEQSFALYYPSPRFYWTNRKNSKAMERINAGLAKAYQDGKLQALFKQHYQATIDSTHLNKRRIFVLPNTKYKHITSDYKKFLIDFTKPIQ